MVIKMTGSYKYESYKDINFPVYSSLQRGRGALVTPHFHKAAELVRIVNGEGTYCINAQTFLCRKGDIIFNPPYSIHSFTSEDEETEIEGVIFEFTMIPSSETGVSPEKLLSPDVVNQFVINGKDPVFPELDMCFSEARRVYSRDDPTYKLEMLAALFKCTALLIKHYAPGGEKLRSYDRLQPVMEYIQKNYRHSITVSDLSRLLNVCDDHLIRIFKAVTNKTPVSYITDIRLEESMRLLIKTDLSVTEIAGMVGFSSAGYMAHLFKSRLHTTPLGYRKNRHQ